MTQSRFAIVALVTEVSRGLTGPTPVVRAGFMAFTIISSSSHSRIGTGDLNRIPKQKTLEGQPATASLISSEGTKVYTGCIRGKVGLAGRCSIGYEQRILRVSGESDSATHSNSWQEPEARAQASSNHWFSHTSACPCSKLFGRGFGCLRSRHRTI